MSERITVACKLPNGLIVTHGRMVMQDGKPRIDNNGRVVLENSQTVTLLGSNSRAHGTVINGYGITRNVDADWFNDWVERNRDSYGPLICGAIFAVPVAEYIDGMTAEASHVRHGIEPLIQPRADASGKLLEYDPRAYEGNPAAQIETRTDGPA